MSEFDAAYYAAHADALGWGAGHTPDAFKLAFLHARVTGDSVLDLACGPGVYAAALARGTRRVVGADLSRELLRRGRGAAAWRAVAASGLALPFAARAFDTTLLLSVLEHVDDRRMLAEAARVTRRRMLIQVPLAEPGLLEQSGLLFSHWSDRSHLRLYGEQSLADLVASAGWRMTEFVPAYPRDLQEAYVRGLAVPDLVRQLVRLVLKPLRGRSPRPPAEAFAVAEPA